MPCQVICYYRNALISSGGSSYLFLSFTGTRNVIPGSQISYNNTRMLFQRLLSSVGLSDAEIREYGLHSMRIDSATNAAQGCGELEIQRAGRWRTASTAQDYMVLDEVTRAKSSSVLLG